MRTCPICLLLAHIVIKEIQLNEAVSHQIKEDLLKQFEKESKKKELELTEKFRTERDEIERKAKENAEEKNALVLRDLRQQVEEEKKKCGRAETAELDLLKKIREVENKEKNLELDLERRLADEKQKIEETVTIRFADQQRLKDLRNRKN